MTRVKSNYKHRKCSQTMNNTVDPCCSSTPSWSFVFCLFVRGDKWAFFSITSRLCAVRLCGVAALEKADPLPTSVSIPQLSGVQRRDLFVVPVWIGGGLCTAWCMWTYPLCSFDVYHDMSCSFSVCSNHPHNVSSAFQFVHVYKVKSFPATPPLSLHGCTLTQFGPYLANQLNQVFLGIFNFMHSPIMAPIEYNFQQNPLHSV